MSQSGDVKTVVKKMSRLKPDSEFHVVGAV